MPLSTFNRLSIALDFIIRAMVIIHYSFGSLPASLGLLALCLPGLFSHGIAASPASSP